MLIWIPFFLIILMAFYIILSYRLDTQAAENLKNRSYTYQLYAMRYVKSGDFQSLNEDAEKTASHLSEYISEKSGFRTQIYGVSQTGNPDENFLLMADSDVGDILYTKDISVAASKKCYTYFYLNNRKYLSFSSPVFGEDGKKTEAAAVIRLIYPMDTEYIFLFKVIGSIVGFTFIIMFLNIFLTKLMTEKITVSINELKESVSMIQSGSKEKTVEIKSGDEIEELGYAFNEMQRRIGAYVNDLDTQSRQMQLFFNGAAHQLKTPLTSIIGYSQMIQVSEDPDEICEDAFIIEEAGEKLLKSINTLIAGSRHGSDVRPIQPTEVCPAELAEECVLLLKPRLNKLHIDCEITGGRDIKIISDREILKEIILTILDNAIIHGECGRIQIDTKKDCLNEGKTLIEIADDGKGIDFSDRDLIFKAFYQSNDSLGKGSGLGLSVCASLAGRLGGEIHLAEKSTGGCKFVIELPMEITH